jgi:arsenate reductase-like glutaredoxin family protein
MLSARLRLAAWLALLLAASPLCGGELSTPKAGGKQSGQFLRLARDKDRNPLALETAIVRFAPADAKHRLLTVDLVAAVHIAEKSYYERLNRELATYDVVLYELVAPEEFKVPRQSDCGNDHPISILQNGIKDILGLEFQLKGIDYTCQNMVHADMSPDQFSESMRKRGESVMTMIMRVLGDAMTRSGESTGGASSGQLLLALFDKNRTLALRRIFAEEFEESEGSFAALEGRAGSTLISGRNEVALGVLRKQIAAGRARIAIFYGAAHMPNFQTRLHAEFGLVPVSTRWLVAWNLKS